MRPNKSIKSVDDYIKVEIPVMKPSIRLVIPAKEKPGTLKALTEIRNRFGKNGEFWTTGNEHEHYDVGEKDPTTGKVLTKELDKFCLIGAVYDVDGRYENAARAAIAMAIAEQQYALDDLGTEEYTEYSSKENVEDVSAALEDTEIITDYNDEGAWPEVLDILNRAKVLIKKADTK